MLSEMERKETMAQARAVTFHSRSGSASTWTAVGMTPSVSLVLVGAMREKMASGFFMADQPARGRSHSSGMGAWGSSMHAHGLRFKVLALPPGPTGMGSSL